MTQLCLRLDGLPLAIELAAARCRLLSPQTLLKRIEGDGVGRQTGQSLMLLHRETPSGPTRQQTLLQTLDWSYQLLDTQTQRLFARLGIFVGGWTLEAAQVICQQQDAQSSADELFDQMERLSSQSLVVSLPPEVDVLDEEPPQRFRFLEPIREYALKRLKESSEWQVVRQRHMQYYLSLAEAIEPDMVGGQRRRAVQQLLREQNNLRAALSWSLEQGQADVAQRLCSAMALFWESRSQFQEAQRWIDAALHMKQPTPVPTRAKLVLAASQLANWKAALEQSRHLAHEAASLYEACGDTIGRARALFQVGDTWYLQGKYEQASDYFEQCLQLQQNGGEQRDYYFTLGRLGAVWTLQGNFAQAEDCLTAALTFFRASDEQWGLTSLLVLLGVLYLVQGKHHQALDMLREGMVLAQTVGQHFNIAIALSSIGCTVGFMGNVSIAARICSAAEALYERLGSSIPTAYLPLYTQYLTMMKTQVDEQTWQTCWAQGRGLSTEQVITLVLEECQQLLRK